jgi:hypothetical protein
MPLFSGTVQTWVWPTNAEETEFRVHVLTTPATASRLLLRTPTDYLIHARRRGGKWFLTRDGKNFGACPEELVPELDIALDAYHQIDWTDPENAAEVETGFWVYQAEMEEKVPEGRDAYLTKRSLTIEDPVEVESR